MAKLNQIIAVEKGVKSKSLSVLSELYKIVQKPDLFNGFSKTYSKKDEDSESLPPERKRVQYDGDYVMKAAETALTEVIEITARKDFTNCVAKASVKVDGVVLVENAPVSFLLFLEKQMTDLRTFLSALPILDETEEWKKDENDGIYKAVATSTHRTKKVQRPIVLYAATPEHPAQTQLITEDVIVGFWNQTKHSGAFKKTERDLFVERIDLIMKAIKEAREEANLQDEVPVPDVPAKIFSFLLER